MRRDGDSVFPAHANTGDPNSSIEACPLMRTHAHALIAMMAPEHDTLQSEAGYRLMQDRSPPIRRNLLATHGRTIHWVKQKSDSQSDPFPSARHERT